LVGESRQTATDCSEVDRLWRQFLLLSSSELAADTATIRALRHKQHNQALGRELAAGGRKMNTSTILCSVAVIVIAMLGAVWIGDPSPVTPISVSVKALPDALTDGKKTRVVLQAKANDCGLSHGETTIAFWPLDYKAARGTGEPQKISGWTDAQGMYLTNWSPSCPGCFMVTAEVKKPGYRRGRAICYFESKE
jgi:hypothetical protein